MTAEARCGKAFIQEARRALDNTLVGVRVHLDSLHAAVRAGNHRCKA